MANAAKKVAGLDLSRQQKAPPGEAGPSFGETLATVSRSVIGQSTRTIDGPPSRDNIWFAARHPSSHRQFGNLTMLQMTEFIIPALNFPRRYSSFSKLV